jgi:hypothetical protein
VICVYNLNMIRSVVSAHLLRLEQVNCLDVSRDVELPLAEHVVSQAVDWLVRLDEGVVVIEETEQW